MRTERPSLFLTYANTYTAIAAEQRISYDYKTDSHTVTRIQSVVYSKA